MTNERIAKMLDLHSVDWFLKAGHIIAIEYYTTRNGRTYEAQKDLTGSSRLELLDWLGYDSYGT